MGRVSGLSNIVLRGILKAIQEQEDDNTTFTSICDREVKTLGSVRSKKRRLCQYQRKNFLLIAKTKPEAYLALLAKHNLPARMPKPATLNRRGKTHSDQNKNDVDLSFDEYDSGKFVFVHILCFGSSLSTSFLPFFSCFAEEDEAEYNTPPRAPLLKNTKATSRPSLSARKQNGSSSKKPRKMVEDVDSDDEEEEEEILNGKYFVYKNGEEGFADKIIHVHSKRGQGHLNDPVDYIARLDRGVRMEHEGGM